MIRHWTLSTTELCIRALTTNRSLRTMLLALYYLAILVGLVLLYGKGDFSTPKFIYQGF